MKHNERTWAAFCHLGALSKFIGVPFGNLIVPVVLWIIGRGESVFIDDHGKESINFQISMTIYMFLAFAGIIMLCIASGVGSVLLTLNPAVLLAAIISAALVPGIAVALLVLLDIVLIIIAAVKA